MTYDKVRSAIKGLSKGILSGQVTEEEVKRVVGLALEQDMSELFKGIGKK